MSELSDLINSGLQVRRKLIQHGRSRTDLSDLFPKVVYWIATSKNVEKTALLRRNEILIVLPPNFVNRFNELIKNVQ